MKRILQIAIMLVFAPCLQAQFAGVLTKDGFTRLENNLAILAPDENLRGTFQWQTSSDMIIWTDAAANINGNAIALHPEQMEYYRLKITEENCSYILYTDTAKIFSRHTTIFEYLDEGLSVPVLLTGGFSIMDLYEGGVLVGTLEQSGVDSVDLLNAGLIGTVSDYEGNSYEWVRIGDQVWMAENLKATRYSDGTPIPLETHDFRWEIIRSGAYCWYRNDSARYADPYGALYNWYAIDTTSNGGRNVCPSGWHVPSDAEWTELTNLLGGENMAGGKLKESGTTHWLSPNNGATNESGFTALPGGIRWDFGFYSANESRGQWWSSTASSFSSAWCRGMQTNTSSCLRQGILKYSGSSVRCLRD